MEDDTLPAPTQIFRDLREELYVATPPATTPAVSTGTLRVPALVTSAGARKPLGLWSAATLRVPARCGVNRPAIPALAGSERRLEG